MLPALAFSVALTAQPTMTVVRAGKLLDVVSGTLKENQVISIEGDTIKEVGPSVAIPPGAKVIDLGRYTVLPGLIDGHTHITAQPGNYYDDLFRKSPIDVAVTAHVYARRTLEAGFTSCRDVGSGEFVDVALRNAINRGDVLGPRLLVAGLAIGSTGGHADTSGFSPYLKFGTFSGVADGVEAIRKLVRFNVKYGADLIKMVATAGVLSEEESVGAPQYTPEEMRALVNEAHMWEKRVAAHAHGAEGIKRALQAGVDSIEHASFIDEEGIGLAKERGAFLVMDVYNDDYIVAEYQRLGYPQKIIEKEKKVGRTQRENFQRAVRAGARLAFGTDAGVYPHGDNAKQFAKMVEWGQTPVEAIRAATLGAAELLGLGARAGSLSAGKWADLIAVEGDPLKDVRLLERVAFVMKAGAIYKQPPR